MGAEQQSESTQPQFPSVKPTGGHSTLAATARPAWQRSLLGSGGAALLLVVLAAALLVVIIFGGAAASATEPAYRFVPRDAAYAIELRVDMPSGQREELLEFATTLPGFEGNFAVFQRIDEALSDGVDRIAGPDADYSRDVAPWFA